MPPPACAFILRPEALATGPAPAGVTMSIRHQVIHEERDCEIVRIATGSGDGAAVYEVRGLLGKPICRTDTLQDAHRRLERYLQRLDGLSDASAGQHEQD